MQLIGSRAGATIRRFERQLGLSRAQHKPTSFERGQENWDSTPFFELDFFPGILYLSLGEQHQASVATRYPTVVSPIFECLHNALSRPRAEMIG